MHKVYLKRIGKKLDRYKKSSPGRYRKLESKLKRLAK